MSNIHDDTKPNLSNASQTLIESTESETISMTNSTKPIPQSTTIPIPPPPSTPAPIPKSKSRSNSIIPLRWRPDTNLRPNNMIGRTRRGRRQIINNRAARMSETAKRMLGLMSVMMAGRAQGITTGIYSKQANDIQTGLDGNIC